MDFVRISVKDIVGSKAIEASSGEKIRETIAFHIKKGNSVVLDFKGVTSILSLFLNPAVGDLYGEFSEIEVREHLRFTNLPTEYGETFKRVIDRAKEFYKNRDVVTKIIDKETGYNNEDVSKN